MYVHLPTPNSQQEIEFATRHSPLAARISISIWTETGDGWLRIRLRLELDFERWMINIQPTSKQQKIMTYVSSFTVISCFSPSQKTL